MRNWYKEYIEFQSKCVVRTTPETIDIVERVVEGHRSSFEPFYIKYTPHKVLVIGCGEMHELEALYRLGACPDNLFGGTVIQNDINLGNYYFSNRFKNVSLQDIHKMSYDDSCFDTIISKHTLEHSPAPYIAFCELNRALQLGGILYLEIPIEYEDKINPFEAKYVENTHLYGFHHIFCLYPSQVLNLGIKTGFNLLEYYKGGGGYDYIFRKEKYL